LRRAEHAEELEVLFQPIVAVSDGELLAAEALLRWNHPEHGLLTPREFLVVAEESGLITEIGGWVLDQAVERIAEWELPIAVNLSARQVCDPDMVDRVRSALRLCGARADLLWFDIPEPALAASPAVSAALEALTHVGVRLAIDDFGAGSSSVFDLSGLPVSAVKFDAGVTARLPGDREAVTAVRSTVALGHALGLQIVGEGVEREAQLEVLRELGCDAAQGFHVAAPMPAGRFEETWLGGRPAVTPTLSTMVDVAR
jgi:EAL domain-containing protein (putative c-di-GMP-specific phosphodiesterase class I)